MRFLAFALQRESALRRCASIRIYALANRRASMPLRCIAERRVSAQRHCNALPPTPRPALPSRFDTRPCISFALLIEASLIQAIYAYLRRCAALSSLALPLPRAALQ